MKENLKKSYELCKSLDFNENIIIKYCINKDLDSNIILVEAKEYIKTIYGNSPLNFIDELELNFLLGNSFIIQLKKYENFVKENKIILELTSPGFILVKIKIALLKIFIKYRFNKEIIYKKLTNWGLNPDQTIINVAKFVYNEQNTVNNKTQEKLKQGFKLLIDKNLESYTSSCKKILTAETDEEIIDLFEHSLYDLTPSRFQTFIASHHSENYDGIQENLNRKYDIYRKYKDKISKAKTKEQVLKNHVEKLYNAEKIFNAFVNSPLIQNRLAFCLQYNLSLKIFENYVHLIKKHKPDLYQTYPDRIKELQEQYFNKHFDEVNLIVNYIENGIIENDVLREFNLLDYYFITKIPLLDTLKICEAKLPVEKRIYFRKFISTYKKHKLLSLVDIQSIIDETTVININFDDDGNPIANTGRLITKEEKEEIFNFLKENDIPPIDYIYIIALNRLINGNLYNNINGKSLKI